LISVFGGRDAVIVPEYPVKCRDIGEAAVHRDTRDIAACIEQLRNRMLQPENAGMATWLVALRE